MLPYRRNINRSNVEIVPIEPEQYVMVRNPDETLSIGKLALTV